MANTGNRLIDFGWVDTGTKSHIIEVDNTDQSNIVFEAVLSGFPTGSWAYRAERMSLYPEAGVSRINAGIRTAEE